MELQEKLERIYKFQERTWRVTRGWRGGFVELQEMFERVCGVSREAVEDL